MSEDSSPTRLSSPIDSPAGLCRRRLQSRRGRIDRRLAELAAGTITEALAAGDTSREVLKVYEQRIHEELWPSMKRSYFMQRWLLRFPSLVDFLIVRAQENGSIAQTFLAKL